MKKMIEDINRLRKERNAIILAHNYVLPEVQDIADFVGDSLELSIKARDAQADVIVFCGVQFMAETAKILSPERVVLHPNPDAGCPMADMADAARVRALKAQHPDAALICYVNSTAEVKAEVDICCTSANVEKIVGLFPPDQKIIFLPDKNLGANIANTLGRKMLLWPGFCPTHHRLTPEMLIAARAKAPDAVVLVHPECPVEVVAEADHALSTGGILRFVQESTAKRFIIGTEQGILHRLRKENPDKEFIEPENPMICPNMKKITLPDVHNALQNMVHRVEMSDELMARARIPIVRMLEQKL
ncbi:MAG: quinolinate synthase NadA [Victivallaceae bacterium]|nr:quinolinate synthase NadA [Victivallaceae bacterium]MDD4181181.1 quinolinate synthase NadA [Victivallaceae bacterium]